MDENASDKPASSPEQSRPRRPPPTIDLEASEVTEKGAGADNEGSIWRTLKDSFPLPSMAALAPYLTAAVTGAVAAVLVTAVAWALLRSPDETRAQPAHESDAKALGLLASRIDDLETRVAKPAPADPALASRLDTLEKSIASLRNELAAVRARSDKLAATLDAAKSSSSPSSAVPSADLAAIEERLNAVERLTRSDSDKIAQNADKPADDTALRRLVVASILDISVRQSEQFTATLAAAKALTSNPDALKPLENFAAHGVPNPASLTRELLTLVPKLSPPPPPANTTGVVDRLKAGAAKLVRIERTDATGNDRDAIVARITAAAVRNDLADSRREVEALSPADREPAQAWLDKVKERDAALAAAHHFVNEAMGALAKPAQ